MELCQRDTGGLQTSEGRRLRELCMARHPGRHFPQSAMLRDERTAGAGRQDARYPGAGGGAGHQRMYPGEVVLAAPGWRPGLEAKSSCGCAQTPEMRAAEAAVIAEKIKRAVQERGVMAENVMSECLQGHG